MKQRRIAVLAQFFSPEPCAAANRALSLVGALVSAGNDVTVVTTFPSFPQGRLRDGDAVKIARIEERDGFRVVRLFTRTFRGWPGARLLHWLLFACAASIYVACTRRVFDDVIVTMPPITLAMPGLLASWRHRAKLIVDVRDVYPDIAIAMGEWPADGFLARATERVARLLYQRAALISAVTPTALCQIAERNVPEERLLLAPNGFDEPAVTQPAPSRSNTAFVAVYAGNLGLATDVDTILDAAGLLRSEERISVTIVGDGIEGDRVRRRVAQEQLHNVTLLGSLPRHEAMRIIAGADVALVPLRKGIKESIPTKIFDALSIGCPVLVSADGEARATILASGGGVAVEPGNPAALAECLREFASLPRGERDDIGARGRAYVQAFHQRDAIMADYSRRIAAL